MFSFQINENKLAKLDSYKKTLREHFNLFRTPKFKKWVSAFDKVKIKKEYFEFDPKRHQKVHSLSIRNPRLFIQIYNS